MAEQSTATVPRFELRHRLDLAMEWGSADVESIATDLGLSATTIRNYLAGRRVPKRGTLMAWSIRCGVPFDWLAYGDDGPPDQGIPSPRCSEHYRGLALAS